MKKGVGLLAAVLILLTSLGTGTMAGLFLISNTNTFKRAAIETEIIQGINTMEFTKRALAEALTFSFYQSYYSISNRGGYFDMADIPSYGYTPYWIVYEDVYYPEDFTDNFGSGLLSILNYYGNRLENPVDIPIYTDAEIEETSVVITEERRCGGTATPCYYFDNSGECYSQDQCTWVGVEHVDECIGTVIPCEEFSYEDCSSQHGCYQVAEQHIYVGGADVSVSSPTDLRLEHENLYDISEENKFSKEHAVQLFNLFEFAKNNFITINSIQNVVENGINNAKVDNNLPDFGQATDTGADCPTPEQVFETATGMSIGTVESRIYGEISNKITSLENSLDAMTEFDVEININDIEAQVEIYDCTQSGDPCTTSCSFDYHGAAYVLVEIADVENEYLVYDFDRLTTGMRNVVLKFYILSGDREMITPITDDRGSIDWLYPPDIPPQPDGDLPSGYCGDRGCGAGETQSNCCEDCGCPPGQECQLGSCVEPSYAFNGQKMEYANWLKEGSGVYHIDDDEGLKPKSGVVNDALLYLAFGPNEPSSFASGKTVEDAYRDQMLQFVTQNTGFGGDHDRVLTSIVESYLYMRDEGIFTLSEQEDLEQFFLYWANENAIEQHGHQFVPHALAAVVSYTLKTTKTSTDYTTHVNSLCSYAKTNALDFGDTWGPIENSAHYNSFIFMSMLRISVYCNNGVFPESHKTNLRNAVNWILDVYPHNGFTLSYGSTWSPDHVRQLFSFLIGAAYYLDDGNSGNVKVARNAKWLSNMIFNYGITHSEIYENANFHEEWEPGVRGEPMIIWKYVKDSLSPLKPDVNEHGSKAVYGDMGNSYTPGVPHTLRLDKVVHRDGWETNSFYLLLGMAPSPSYESKPYANHIVNFVYGNEPFSTGKTWDRCVEDWKYRNVITPHNGDKYNAVLNFMKNFNEYSASKTTEGGWGRYVSFVKDRSYAVVFDFTTSSGTAYWHFVSDSAPSWSTDWVELTRGNYEMNVYYPNNYGWYSVSHFNDDFIKAATRDIDQCKENGEPKVGSIWFVDTPSRELELTDARTWAVVLYPDRGSNPSSVIAINPNNQYPNVVGVKLVHSSYTDWHGVRHVSGTFNYDVIETNSELFFARKTGNNWMISIITGSLVKIPLTSEPTSVTFNDNTITTWTYSSGMLTINLPSGSSGVIKVTTVVADTILQSIADWNTASTPDSEWWEMNTMVATSRLWLNHRVSEANDWLEDVTDEHGTDRYGSVASEKYPCPYCGVGSHDWDFVTTFIIRAYFQFKDSSRLSSTAKQNMIDVLSNRAGTPPIVTGDESYSENHNAMIVSAAYFGNMITGGSNTANINWLSGFLDDKLEHHYYELNSPTYMGSEFRVLWNLYDFADSSTLRNKAKAVLDMLLAEHAVIHVDGMRGGPFYRYYEDKIIDQTDDYYYSISHVYFDTPYERSLQSGFPRTFAWFSSYEVPQIIKDIAKGSKEPFVLKSMRDIASTYYYVTPHSVLATAQGNFPDTYLTGEDALENTGARAHVWDIIFDTSPNKVIFSGNQLGTGDPQKYMYDETDAVQYKNVLITSRSETINYVGVTKVTEDGWTFVQEGRAYVAVRELSNGRIIVEVRDADDYGKTFTDFKLDIKDNSLSVSDSSVTYVNTFGETISSPTIYTIDGDSFGSYELFESTYLVSDWGSGVITVKWGGSEYRIQ